jgi:neutral ceramidase
MKAGFHEADITPALGMETPGGYGKVYAAQIHDPLKVRAAVFDDGNARVALVGVDTCALQSARAIAQARAAIAARCGIEADQVMVGASHTHSGGPFFGLRPDDVADAPALVQDLALNHSTAADPIYCDWVVQQICTAVCEADRKKEHAALSVGSGFEDQVAFNRRFRMANGRSYTHPGKGNPGIVEPAGPTDPEVGVVAAWSDIGALLGLDLLPRPNHQRGDGPERRGRLPQRHLRGCDSSG